DTIASRAVFAHLLIGNEFLDVQPGGTTGLFLEMVRLLTFETLEMTHTCCVLKNTSRERLLAHYKPAQHLLQNENDPFDSSMKWSSLQLIMNRDLEETARIRCDQLEQDKAGQLHSLMEEFTPVVHAVYSSRGTFVPFLWGYWRQRISELFAVDKDMLGEMKQSLNNVETRCGSQTPEDWEEWRDLEWKLDERMTNWMRRGHKLLNWSSLLLKMIFGSHMRPVMSFAAEEHISAAPSQEQSPVYQIFKAAQFHTLTETSFSYLFVLVNDGGFDRPKFSILGVETSNNGTEASPPKIPTAFPRRWARSQSQ
ncbi:hypothetical protein FALBO_11589, partial [Fusarium albosuccineum]